MSIKIKLNNDWVDTNIKAVRGVNHVNSEDVYTKEETEKKFATKTEVQTQINNSITKENIENTIEAWLEEDNESTNGEVYTKQESDTLFSGKVSKTDIVQSTGTSTTAVMSQKAVSEISDKVDELEDEVLQLGKDMNGVRETGSVTSSAIGRSWIVLSTPLKAGVQYHLIFSKTAYGSVATELATAQDASAIIDSIGNLSYFTEDTEFDITPSADAKFISLWRGGTSVEMTVSVVATVKGMIDDVLDLEDSVSANTANISSNSSSISDIIKVLGKGTEEQIETTYVENYRIGIDGAITSDAGCKYSTPIPVSRGDILLLTAFVSSITSTFNKTDESGSFYSPLLGRGVGNKTYLYYCIEDGYVAVSCARTAPISALKKNSISILDSISHKIVELEDKPDREFNTMLPSYVFGIESGSFGGREYATALYPEAIVSTQVQSEDGQPENPNVQIYARLNGTKRLLFQKSKTSKSASYNTPVESIAKVATIGGDGLVSKTFNLDYIRANRKNGQNKKMFILIIGASITQQGGYAGYLQMYGDMDNADIGGIDVKVLGSNVGTVTPSITYNYNGETKTIITHTEGRAGWTTYGIANWPFEARADGAINTLGAEGMWYAAGLATKTPFDSNTPGQEWESWEGTTEQRITAFTSVFGRFKPDYCEELWNALHNFHTRYRSGAHTIWYYSTGAEYADGATIPAYNSATSDQIMEQFFDALCYNPDNVFYDRGRARAYTGAYVWSYKTAFSIAKWVERYRTLDDNGNQLTLGEGTGTFVTSANINNPVCTPTIVFNGMGANDLTGMYVDSWHTIAGIKDAIKNLLIDFLDDLHTQLPTAPIGWGCPRQSGVFYPEDWYDFGVIPKITFYSVHRDWLNALMMPEFASLDIANKYNYVPIYFTSSPVSGQSPRYVGDFDRKDSERNLVVTGGDLGHVGEEWEKSVAYQILAWMYWAFQPTEQRTNLSNMYLSKLQSNS